MRWFRRAPNDRWKGLDLALLMDKATWTPAARRVRLFHVVTTGSDLLVGLTEEELAILEPNEAAERIAGRLATDGELVAWRYAETRTADGDRRLVPRERISVRRGEALTVAAYKPDLAVLPPLG